MFIDRFIAILFVGFLLSSGIALRSYMRRLKSESCAGDLIWNDCASACPTYCGSPLIYCIEVCKSECDCPQGSIRKFQNSSICVASKNCFESCDSDSNCTQDSWCRVTEDVNHKQCAPFAQENEVCGGYTPPELEMRCASNLSCEERRDPKLDPVDLPGKCTDKVNNCQVSFEENGQIRKRNYSIGDSFKGFNNNWCNTCICGPNGEIGCTKKYCMNF